MTDLDERPPQTGGGLMRIGGLIDLNAYERARQREAARAAVGQGVPSAPAQPDCKVCGGAGKLKYYHPQGDYGVGAWRYSHVDCDCTRGASAERRQRRLDRWSSLEDDHAGDTFGRARVFAHQGAAFERARVYAADPRGFLVLMGEYGHGKSFLAACVAWESYHAGRGVLWIKAGDLVAHLRDTYQRQSETTQSEQMREMGDAPLLCLDDLGAETDARDVQSHINALIDRRYLKKLPTVIATNKTLDELGGRIASRAAQDGMLVYVGGGDKRMGVDEPSEGLTKYHYYDNRPLLCGQCHGRPHLDGCPMGGEA